MVDAALLQQASPLQAKFLLWQNAWRSTARPKQIPEEAAKLWAGSTDIDPQVAGELVANAVQAGHWGLSFNPEALTSAAKGLALTDGIESVDWNSLATTEYLPDSDKGQLP